MLKIKARNSPDSELEHLASNAKWKTFTKQDPKREKWKSPTIALKNGESEAREKM